MSREFEIQREVALPATPEQVFAAVTTDSEAWLFPTGVAVDARVGSTTSDGSTITAWDPPHHFAARAETGEGTFNALEFIIEGRDGGSTVLRYVHSGILADEWEDQYDGIDAHTDFYLHTLGEYLKHFAGRPITYVGGDSSAGIMGPASSSAPGSFAKVRSALGVDTAVVGDSVTVQAAGRSERAVVSYLTDNFLELRTSDALYCFFGRETWGGPVAVAAHVYADGVDVAGSEKAWQGWLDSVFA